MRSRGMDMRGRVDALLCDVEMRKIRNISLNQKLRVKIHLVAFFQSIANYDPSRIFFSPQFTFTLPL